MGPVTAGGTGPARPWLDSLDPSGEVEEDRDALRPQCPSTPAFPNSHPRNPGGKKRGDKLSQPTHRGGHSK